MPRSSKPSSSARTTARRISARSDAAGTTLIPNDATPHYRVGARRRAAVRDPPPSPLLRALPAEAMAAGPPSDERDQHDRHHDSDGERDPPARDEPGDQERHDSDRHRQQEPHRITAGVKEPPQQPHERSDEQKPDEMQLLHLLWILLGCK